MKYSICKRRPHEYIVQNNLSLTPSQIAEMTKKGIPVSTQSLQGIYETPTQGHDVDPIYQRGVDMNDLWNAQKCFGSNCEYAGSGTTHRMPIIKP